METLSDVEYFCLNPLYNGSIIQTFSIATFFGGTPPDTSQSPLQRVNNSNERACFSLIETFIQSQSPLQRVNNSNVGWLE